MTNVDAVTPQAVALPDLQSHLGSSALHSITIAGLDLCDDLMGNISFSQMSFLVVAGRLPTAGEARMFDAALVALCDHGMTPTAIAARLTFLGAPESVQGAIAAGLLGGGDLFLGVVENTARMLRGVLDSQPQGYRGEFTDEELAELAKQAVSAIRADGRYVPGVGHRIHKEGDPRTARLYAVAEEADMLGNHLRLLRFIEQEVAAAHGRRLPLNGAGTVGAVLADLGFHPSIVRGFAVVSRSAGLVGHLWEEKQIPMGRKLQDLIGEITQYSPPAPSF